MGIETRSPYCQIEARDIAGSHCEELQQVSSAEQCFGCGSSHRKCVRCKAQSVAFPEIDLCSVCLEIEIAQEQIVSTLPRGESCGNCGQRKIRYQEYRLCLHCTVDEHRRPGDSEGEADTPVGNGAKPARRGRKSRKPLGLIYDRVRALVMQCDSTSVAAAARCLNISPYTVNKAMQQLEEEGVVGPAQGNRPRQVLKREEARTTALAPVPANGAVPLTALLGASTQIEALLNASPEDRVLIGLGLGLLIERLRETSNAAELLQRRVQEG